MTELELRTARALGRVSFMPGTWSKRFARAMHWQAEHAPSRRLTPRQADSLRRLAWRYRRQLPLELTRTLFPQESDPFRRGAQMPEPGAPPPPQLGLFA